MKKYLLVVFMVLALAFVAQCYAQDVTAPEAAPAAEEVAVPAEEVVCPDCTVDADGNKVLCAMHAAEAAAAAAAEEEVPAEAPAAE